MMKLIQSIMPSSFNVTNFFFIRHGETNFNKEKRYAGHIDIPLNENGINQVTNLINLLKKQNINLIYTSPLQRALQTANIIATQLNIPIVIINELKERNFGSFQGKKKLPYNKKNFLNGQTLYCYNKQILRGFKKLKNLNCALIIAHSGTYKCLTKHLSLSQINNISNATLLNFKMNAANTWKVCKLSKGL